MVWMRKTGKAGRNSLQDWEIKYSWLAMISSLPIPRDLQKVSNWVQEMPSLSN